ncbi:hypothetical protein GCM10011628_02790 [Lactobacillus acetotolerans DSM 20749 = JCM 3825]|nr:hypothetical protein GCM10011628_02790 [Lactobacillus acetotolerans DSM 20749 = JCM 3825]
MKGMQLSMIEAKKEREFMKNKRISKDAIKRLPPFKAKSCSKYRPRQQVF